MAGIIPGPFPHLAHDSGGIIPGPWWKATRPAMEARRAPARCGFEIGTGGFNGNLVGYIIYTYIIIYVQYNFWEPIYIYIYIYIYTYIIL